jgi:hypothetical protein
MSSSFVSRLPVGNELLKKSTNDLLQVILGDSRVKGSAPKAVAIRREWCAALVWMDENESPTVATCQALSDEEKRVVSELLGVDSAKRGLAQRLSAALAAGDDMDDENLEKDSFLELIKEHGHDQAKGLDRISKQAGLLMLGSSPLKSGLEGADVQLVRERCAMHLWLSQITNTSEVLGLKKILRDGLLEAMGIPKTVEEKTRANMLGVMLGIQELSAGNSVSGQQSQVMQRTNSSLVPIDLTSSIWEKPISGYGSFEANAGARSDIHEHRRKFRSLGMGITELLSAEELKELNDKRKAVKGYEDPAAIARPYARFPWCQTLEVSDSQKFDAARCGRMLMNASRYTNASFTLPMEQMDRTLREREREDVLTSFDEAMSSHNIGHLLMAVERIKGYTRRLFESLKSASAMLARQYPLPEFEEIKAGREAQSDSLTEFFDRLSRRIEEQSMLKGSASREMSLAGFWISFVEAWRTKAASADDLDAVLKRGFGFGSAVSSSGGSPASSAMGGGGWSSSSAGFLRSPGSQLRGTPPAKSVQLAAGGGSSQAGGSSSRAGAGRGKKYILNMTWPSSEDILGPVLGIGGPPFDCHACGQSGHWKGECPVFWGKKGKSLPGWTAQGQKIPNMWNGENPTKECYKSWVKFVTDVENYPDGGAPAALEGAPDIEAFKHRAKKGAGP